MRHHVGPDDALPGIPVLGFPACATAVRRTAFFHAGGFHPGLQFLGEEELFATDLARHGWEIRSSRRSWCTTDRDVVSDRLEQQLRLLEPSQDGSTARQYLT